MYNEYATLIITFHWVPQVAYNLIFSIKSINKIQMSSVVESSTPKYFTSVIPGANHGR